MRVYRMFLKLGLEEKAQLEFELNGPNSFRLTRVVDKGNWRSGNAPHERTTSSRSSKIRSFAQTASAKPASPGLGMTSFPFGDRNEILRLADLYWSLITATEAAEERTFEQELSIARKQGFLGKSLFVRLARWKSVRQTPNYESNDEATIRKATTEAFAATDARIALSALTQLRE